MARGPGAGADGSKREEERGGTKVGWFNNVDRLLDHSPVRTALRTAFIRYQDPKTAAIPPASLLPALQLFFKRVLEERDSRAGKLLFRPITRDDLDTLAEEDPILGINRPADIDAFREIAMKVAKRVMVDRGKRLGLYVIGGVVVVHVVKGVARRLPFLGPAVGVVLSLVPTKLVGPVVGVAGALLTST